MAVRREPRSPGGHSLPHGDFRALVIQSGGPERPVTIGYVRYTAGNPAPVLWRPSSENAALVDVPGAEGAPTLEEGKRLARATLARLESGEAREHERPYDPVVRVEIVAEIDHPTKMLKATILRWPDGYEVRTVGYVPDGYTLPVAMPSLSQDIGCEWGRLDLFERLLADTEEEALHAAREELDRLAADGDLPVRDRSSTPKG